MAYIYDLTDTWNAGGTTFYGIKMNVTNTASAAGSKLLSLQVAGSEVFGVTPSGNVGIGTATPSAKLSVVGTAKIGEGAASNSAKLMVNTVSGAAAGIQLFQDGNESWVIENPASTTALTFANSGTERMRIAANGYVGIGTNAPDSKLHVAGTGGEGFVTVSDNTQATIRLSMSGGAQSDFTMTDLATILRTNAGQPLLFSTNATERMRIDTSGNVGIGTTSPDYKLTAATNGASTFNYVASVNTTAVGAYGAGFLARAGSGFSYFYMRGDGIAYLENATANPLGFATNSTERVRIDASGNVGIGTTAPATKFVVSNSGAAGIEFDPATGIIQTYNRATTAYTDLVTSGLQQRFFSGSSPAERMRIDASGNVGIGTSSPAAKLQVVGNMQVVGTSGVASTTLISAISGLSNGYEIVQSAANALTYNWRKGDNTVAMTLDSAGNLGIGTSSPAYKLDVSATGNISGRVKTSGALNAFYMEDAGTTAGALYIGSVGNDWRVVTGSNERMRIDASGNVQVGTGAIATTATDGFLYIPTCAGTPTGTPTAKTGFAPMVVDSTNNKLYVYVGGAWQAMN